MPWGHSLEIQRCHQETKLLALIELIFLLGKMDHKPVSSNMAVVLDGDTFPEEDQVEMGEQKGWLAEGAWEKELLFESIRADHPSRWKGVKT